MTIPTRPPRPASRHRPDPRALDAGFTVVELLVTVAIAMVLMGAVYQVLVTNQRVSLVQSEQILSQQTVRAGLDLLSQELREVSVAGGDLLTLEGARVGFRAPRAFGLTCQVVPNTPPTLTLAQVGRPFEAGDAVYVFAEGNPNRSDDDEWFSVTVQSVTDGATCGADGIPAQTLVLAGPATIAEVNRIRTGAPVRSWVPVEYGFGVIDGESFLVRNQDGTSAPLVGPLDPNGGLEFQYLATNGSVTADAGSVTRIRITLRTLSEARDAQGRRVADTLTTTVFLRN